MREINRYVLRQLIIATAFVTVTMTFAVWLIQSLRFVDLIVNRGLSVLAFLELVVLLLPSYFSVVLPIATFLAILFVYHKLVSDSEIVVLRAAGLGPLGLAVPGLILAGAVTVILYSITLYFQPSAYRDFKDLQFRIRNNLANILLEEGVFTPVGKNMTLFVRERTSDGSLIGILVNDRSDPDEPETLIAERGRLVISTDGPRLALFNGNRQVRNVQEDSLSMLFFEQYAVKLGSGEESDRARWREPSERYLPGLLFPDNSPSDRRVANKLIAAGHNRLTTPLMTLALAGIALAALLSGEHMRRGHGRRVALAVAIAIPIIGGSAAFHNLAAKVPSLTFLMYVNALLPFFVALLLLSMSRLPRPAPAPGF